LKDSIESDKIDPCFYTEETSCSNAIMEIFKKRFAPEKIHRGDNFNSVAQGLARVIFI